MPNGDGYIAAAYLIFLAILLSYVAIMAVRLSRVERELTELNELLAQREAAGDDDREPVGGAA
jgi:hypothetical protein